MATWRERWALPLPGVLEQVAYSEEVLIFTIASVQGRISLTEVTTHEMHKVQLSDVLRKVLWAGR